MSSSPIAKAGPGCTSAAGSDADGLQHLQRARGSIPGAERDVVGLQHVPRVLQKHAEKRSILRRHHAAHVTPRWRAAGISDKNAPCMASLAQSAAWQALSAHAEDVRPRHLRDLFAEDPERGLRMTAEAAGVFLDYSKNRVTAETLELLVRLARERGVRERIDAMFEGRHINSTEDRAVLHIALRTPSAAHILVDGSDVVPGVHQVLETMAVFAERVRAGGWHGHTGRPVRAVVNIGIGGSDLGPVMAYEALAGTRSAR